MNKEELLSWLRAEHLIIENTVLQNWPDAVVPPKPPADPAVGYDFLDSFEGAGPLAVTENGKYQVHSGNVTDGQDLLNRLSIYTPGRHGKQAVRLTTRGKDFNHNSGVAERCDLALTIAQTGVVKGAKQWWAHSVLFPDNWQPLPNYDKYQGAFQSIFSFHWDGTTGQGNVNVNLSNVHRTSAVNDTPHFHINIYGGAVPGISGRHDGAILGGALPRKNIWYDFMWYIEWTSEPTGRVIVWTRVGDEPTYKLQFEHTGPTLFRKSATEDYGAYLKIGNYHAGNTGVESSVVHDRVVRGKTMASVALAQIG